MKISGRPWPPPRSPWAMFQRWHDLLFAHWRIGAEKLRDLVPRELSLDIFDGYAWVAVTPFRMSGVRLRGLPPIPGTSRFPEVNVRTYVSLEGKPGVYFFSLDADNPLAVAAARRFFRLPYYQARMKAEGLGSGVSYRCERWEGELGARFEAWYAPVGAIFASGQGTLEHWLTERYCLYTVNRGIVHRVEIDHAPWPLQPARADIHCNTMTTAAGITISDDPLLHFAKELAVRIWMPKRVR